MAVVFGTRHSDRLDGTSSADVFWAGAARDKAFGGDGDDVFHDEPFQIIIPQKTGRDFFEGGAGNDTFYYIDGKDVLLGGAGDDVFALEVSKEIVRVNGGDGIDTAHIKGLAEVDAQVSVQGDRTVITDGDGFKLVLRGVEDFDFAA